MNTEHKLIFLAALCFQANRRVARAGNYNLPSGFREVMTFASRDYPLAGLLIESSNEIILAFRGTEASIDVIADIDWRQVPYPFVQNGGWTDRGFTRNYQSIRKDVIKALQKLSSRKRLYITGHSLDGAITTLAALDIASNTRFTQPHVYTYASPRVGNPEFVKVYNENIHQSTRVVNMYDFVPHFPPRTLPIVNISYKHVDEKYPIYFQTFSIRENHEINNYFDSLCNMFPKPCKEICRQNPKLCPPSQ